MLLRSLAWQRHRPSDSWMAALTQALQPQLQTMPARTIAEVAQGLAGLGYRPGAEWMAACGAAAAARAGEGGLAAADGASLLWLHVAVEAGMPEGLEKALVGSLLADGEAAGGGGVRLGLGAARRAAWALRCLHPDPAVRPAGVQAALERMEAHLLDDATAGSVAADSSTSTSSNGSGNGEASSTLPFHHGVPEEELPASIVGRSDSAEDRLLLSQVLGLWQM